MTERERLIELKIQFVENFNCGSCKPEESKCKKCLTEKEADYLLANGVIVPNCKLGDTMYVLLRRTNKEFDYKQGVNEIVVRHIRKNAVGLCVSDYWGIYDWVIGKNAFFTKEEAEKALKEREKE